jgi:hypothetical protein
MPERRLILLTGTSFAHCPDLDIATFAIGTALGVLMPDQNAESPSQAPVRMTIKREIRKPFSILASQLPPSVSK